MNRYLIGAAVAVASLTVAMPAANAGGVSTPVANTGAVSTPVKNAGGVSTPVANTGASAFGVAATGTVPLAPTPAVASSTDQAARRSLIKPPSNPLVHGGVLSVLAKPSNARSSVARLSIPKAHLAAGVITATCKDGIGNARLAHVSVAGHPLDVAPPANTRVPVKVPGVGTVSVTINKQVRTGDRLSVTALEVSLPLLGKIQTVSVASATCRLAADQAPIPNPIPGHNLPVTG